MGFFLPSCLRWKHQANSVFHSTVFIFEFGLAFGGDCVFEREPIKTKILKRFIVFIRVQKILKIVKRNCFCKIISLKICQHFYGAIQKSEDHILHEKLWLHKKANLTKKC